MEHASDNPLATNPIEAENFSLGDISFHGMPGVGKSEAIRRIAGMTGIQVVDTDALTVKRNNMSIEEMVNRHGWDYFRDEEAKSVLEAIGTEGNKIISLGGGALMRSETVEALKKASITMVYLSASIETLADRILNDDGPVRPGLEKSLGRPAIIKELNRRWEIRGETFIESADVTVDTENKDLEAVAKDAIDGVRKFRKPSGEKEPLLGLS